ncbi:hypothetical protein GP486_004896 [Trichoglossum hirsutum]|uniref:Nudix hydrolase domain-containing protein n=1 Tax=Trichoglossum hirsutum TaxID=265104 RepID=A0A9P8RN85_9PEZI|nr:hypothetical protein GP486_004896 [Trichoglossum hirsutum]
MATIQSSSPPSSLQRFPHPRVGVGIFVMKEGGKFVIGQRRGSHGAGTWGLPGGHLEFGETIEACAKREVLEETGLGVREVRLLTVTDDITDDGRHFVTIFVGCKLSEPETAPEPQVIEPHRCSGWEWATWEELCSYADAHSRTLFLPLQDLREQRPGFHPVGCYARAACCKAGFPSADVLPEKAS